MVYSNPFRTGRAWLAASVDETAAAAFGTAALVRGADAPAAVRRFVGPEERLARVEALLGLLDIAVEGRHGCGFQIGGEGARRATR